jgi:hypothetical protein
MIGLLVRGVGPLVLQAFMNLQDGEYDKYQGGGVQRLLNLVQSPTWLICEARRSKEIIHASSPAIKISTCSFAVVQEPNLATNTSLITPQIIYKCQWIKLLSEMWQLFVRWGIPLLTYSVHTVLLFFSVIFDPWKRRNLIFLEVGLPTLSLICLFTLKKNRRLIKPENDSVLKEHV